jgi:ATP-dependent DNA helicase RecG
MKPNGHTNGSENTLVLPGDAAQWTTNTIEETLTPKSGGHNRTPKRSTRYLHQLLQSRPPLSFEHRIVPNAQLSDLDWSAVDQYVADHRNNLNTTSGKNALVKRSCLAKNEAGQLLPTHAGLLLFGQSPDQFIPSAEIIAVHYNGLEMSDTYTRDEVRGPLPRQIRQAEAFVAQHLPPGFHLNDLDWEDHPTLPLDAVRDVIINAVAHRDYEQGGDSIRLFMFADRLECYSPGRLPGPMTVDNLLTERFSRNEVLVRVLSEMGFVERLGYGLDRLVHRMAEGGLPPPQFEETVAGFKVTLFNRPAAQLAQQTSTPPTQRWLALGLYRRQIKAMNFALEHGRLALSDFGRLCPDTSPGALRRDLDNLVKRDLLLRVGEGPMVYYILK